MDDVIRIDTTKGKCFVVKKKYKNTARIKPKRILLGLKPHIHTQECDRSHTPNVALNGVSLRPISVNGVIGFEMWVKEITTNGVYFLVAMYREKQRSTWMEIKPRRVFSALDRSSSCDSVSVLRCI